MHPRTIQHHQTSRARYPETRSQFGSMHETKVVSQSGGWKSVLLYCIRLCEMYCSRRLPCWITTSYFERCELPRKETAIFICTQQSKEKAHISYFINLILSVIITVYEYKVLSISSSLFNYTLYQRAPIPNLSSFHTFLLYTACHKWHHSLSLYAISL